MVLGGGSNVLFRADYDGLLLRNLLKGIRVIESFSGQNLATSAVLFPVAVAGILSGIWLHNRVPTGLFYTACYVFLALTGVKLVYDGLAGSSWF